jgi:hypothetical protein
MVIFGSLKMNNYQQLYEMVIDGFLKNGFEIYQKSSWICSMRRWKLVHRTEDLKIIESVVNIFYDDEANPTQIITRFAYFEMENL